MSRETLTQAEVAALLALFDATRGSPHAHVPRQAVQARFRKDLRGLVRKVLKKLVRGGYAFEHPTREMTYGITERGTEKLREMNLI